jgi:hypothetical protein
MPKRSTWDSLTDSSWDEFASAWCQEIRNESDADESVAGDGEVGDKVVEMNFTAKPDQQWKFIIAAVHHAETEREISYIAAGPVEHILGWHGEEVIGWIEDQAKVDVKFSRMMTGVWKYRMSDEIWARVQAIQTNVELLPHDSIE